MRAMKLVTSVTLAVALLAYSFPLLKSQITNGFDWLGELSILLKVGASIASAVQSFKEWAVGEEGVAMVTIDNYTNKSHLTNAEFFLKSGGINQLADDIIGGSKEAFSARSKLFGQSEGFAGWSLPQKGVKLVVYWRVPDEISPKPNKLGVGFLKDVKELSGWLKDEVESEPNQSPSFLGTHEYEKEVVVLQCCHGDLCIQGMMTTGHHCNVSIKLLPKRASELFHHKLEVSNEQEYLDETLNLPSVCESRAGYVSSKLMNFAITLIVIVIVH